jgi:4-hydroxy-4-methyl-2-oxoglutarate aldolase
VAVRPGDVVRGDASGLVVVPREHLAEVVELAAAVAQREDVWRRRIASGEALPAATGIDAILADVQAMPERPVP